MQILSFPPISQCLNDACSYYHDQKLVLVGGILQTGFTTSLDKEDLLCTFNHYQSMNEKEKKKSQSVALGILDPPFKIGLNLLLSALRFKEKSTSWAELNDPMN